MALEDVLELLAKAAKMNKVLKAAMINGPESKQWQALETYFADRPGALAKLPKCYEEVIKYNNWRGTTLATLMPSVLKSLSKDHGGKGDKKKYGRKAASRSGKKASSRKASGRTPSS